MADIDSQRPVDPSAACRGAAGECCVGLGFPSVPLVALAGCLFGLVAGLFSLAGSVFLLWYSSIHPEALNGVSDGGLWARVLIFFVGSLAALGGVTVLRGAVRADARASGPVCGPETGHSYWAIAAVLLVAGLLVFPHLGAYPWSAPDEMHHLNVAKNLAVYGEYASGTPQEGFRRFDPYDSVGPPVLLPVAGAFRLFGVSVVAGRWVMALYFLLFVTAVYGLFRPVFGPSASVAAMAGAVVAFSSVYLGRTLYGEVPGLFWLVCGLIAWRKSMGGRWAWGWGSAAGLLFGLAVLCKTILVLSAFAFLAVTVLDAITYRRVRAASLAGPALGGAVVIGGWWLVQQVFSGDVAEGAQGTMGLYQHYLLFGLEPVWGNVRFAFLSYPAAHFVLLLGALTALPILFRRRYDPSLLVLFLLGGFFAYWYVFFTPGQLPRYLWFSYAAGTAFLGAWIGRLWVETPRRFGRVILGLALSIPHLVWVSGQAREVYVNREMADDYALAEAVRALPAQTPVSTSFYPLRGTLVFLTDRPVRVEEPAERLFDGGAAVIVLGDTLQAGAFAGVNRQNIGRYVMLWNGVPEGGTETAGQR